mgnify:CR=1 FL=1
MQEKKLIQALGFAPKENVIGIFQKKYGDYAVEVNLEKKQFNFGNKIKAESKTTLNFSQAENWVVLECVDRLLEKGYKPENITLEKTWKTGHGTSGRLDVLVTRDDGTAYLMLECKTWGKEYEKELKNIHKNGGQLFTYFQQDKAADVLMLYASQLNENNIEYRNDIIKVEEDYRQTANVKDLFERWNKSPKTNGIFDTWVAPYQFKSKALTKQDLQILKQEDSSHIFNRFLEILRHNVVSDKPNAFNKIFTLFLCKIVDEYSKSDNEELEFQWLEGIDDHISFQKRLTDLYGKGMRELLEKNVTDVSDDELDKRFQQVDEQYQREFKRILTEIRLKKNNEFAIKEVYDDDSFIENGKVVKEVVELLQNYKIRYNYRQQFLSNFFESLLTTSLKQESGQFFTPVPITRFILRSLPILEIMQQKIKAGNKGDLLPKIIDYAAGSGHFLTESMEIIQKYLDEINPQNYPPATQKQLTGFKNVQFDWAGDYVYGIEKDYRLVKTAKVSCYLHGDGLATIIHGDGLGNFSTEKGYKELLRKTDKTYPQDNKQFDIIISNPPYSVEAFKGQMDGNTAHKAFGLYTRLTDQSSEIECLFVERTKQLLRDGGVAGVILPNTILSRDGIYIQTREIILKYFDIVAITELGSKTFMATNANTVTLFLRRRNNADSVNVTKAVKRLFTNMQDVTINGIEQPLHKYLAHVWEEITPDDYKTLLQKTPNDNICQHEIYQAYEKKIKVKKGQDKWLNILNLEQEKLIYFILAHPQKVVLLKTGRKNEEKQFLGYEFSQGRRTVGIHPIQRGKSIDECTQLYDANKFENSDKASYFIYNAFRGNLDLDIPEHFRENIQYQNLVDMMTFDRTDFNKNISLTAKKKVTFKTKWEEAILDNLVSFQSGLWTGKKGDLTSIKVLRNTNFKLNNGKLSYDDVAEIEVETKQLETRKLQFGDIILERSGGSDTQAIGRVVLFDKKDKEVYSYSNFCSRISVNDSSVLHPVYLWLILNKFYNDGGTESLQNGVRLLNIDLTGYKRIKIPLPPVDVQEKIVEKIGLLEQEEQEATNKIQALKKHILNFIDIQNSEKKELKYYLETINPNKKASIQNLAPNTEVSFLAMADISNEGEITTIQSRTLKNVKTGYTFFQNDDVLFAKITPCTENGKGALVKGLKNNIGFGSTEFFVLRANKKHIHPKLLFYISQSKDFRIKAEKNMTGTSGHRRVPKPFVESYEVFLPNITDQQKIVNQIEAIEQQIADLQLNINEIPQKKENILKEYL